MSDTLSEKAYLTLVALSAVSALGILLAVILFLFAFGGSALSADFIFNNWNHQHIEQAGVLQAIVGTLALAVGVFAVSVPIGVASAIYLTEYARSTWSVRLIRLAIRNLAGVPSIVYGLFGLALFVQLLALGTSLLAAILTLSAMTLPWIISAGEESLKTVPLAYRQGALALGATPWQTIRHIVLPQSLSGMMTGAILGVSRAIGETAPLILVGATFFMNGLPTGPLDKFMALPYHTFILATQHADPHAKSYAAATAIVLIGLVLMVNGVIFYYRYKIRKKTLGEIR